MSDELTASETTTEASAPAPAAAPSAAVPESSAAAESHSNEPAIPGSSDVPADWAGVPEAESFASVLHAIGVGGDVVRQILNEYDDGADGRTAQKDQQDKAECLAALRSYWSPDQVDANLELARSYLESNLPNGVARLAKNASLGGRLLLNDPETVIALVDIAKRSPRVPPPTGDFERDIRTIEMVMRTDAEKYRSDTGLQLRLRSLYSSRLAKQQRSGHAG